MNVSDGTPIKTTEYYLHIYDALKLEYLDVYGQKHSEAELGQIYNSFQNKDARRKNQALYNEV